MADRHARGDRERILVAGRIDDAERAGRVRDQVLERVGGEPRVEQQRDRAGAHRAEEELDELHAVADQHGDALARAHAKPGKHARHAVHALVELPVCGGPLLAAEQVDDRDLVREPPDRLVEEEAEIAAAIALGSFIVCHCATVPPSSRLPLASPGCPCARAAAAPRRRSTAVP